MPEPGDSGADDPISARARESFHIPYLYPVQRYAVSNTLEGTDQIVILPTGTGKSLCYQLPALLLPHATAVVVPLLSLMNDQLAGLRALGLPAECLRGGQSASERQRIAERLREGTAKILYCTPESISSAAGRRLFGDLPVSHLVVDEAHCVSEWGESFRPSYLRLGEISARLRGASVSAFTATASERVIRKIREILFGDREPRVFTASPDRPNISLEVVPAVSRTRAVALKTAECGRPAIVFSRSRKGCENLARVLRRRYPTTESYFYHAGLDRTERRRVERWFLGSTEGVLVATSAYGMGVDKPDVRTVIHADVPPSIEAYLQEFGRAGRDGAPARACLVWTASDEGFVCGLQDPVARERYRSMLRYARDSGRCRREALLTSIGVEAVACSGCDVCRHAVTAAPEGAAEILGLVRRHPRTLTPRQAVFALSGRQSYEAEHSGLRRLREFGSLRTWEPEDIEEALRTLVDAGRLRILPRGGWRGRLTPSGRGAARSRAPARVPVHADLAGAEEPVLRCPHPWTGSFTTPSPGGKARRDR